MLICEEADDPTINERKGLIEVRYSSCGRFVDIPFGCPPPDGKPVNTYLKAIKTAYRWLTSFFKSHKNPVESSKAK